MTARPWAAVATTALTALILTGCVVKTDAAPTDRLTVASSDTECAISAATATSGALAFDVTNSGSQVTEFYLLASDGLRIIGEVENVAPGASRTLTIVAQPGDYLTVCKPGMIGEGVGRAAFSVTGAQTAVATGDDTEQTTQAVDLYVAFVKDQVGLLLPAVRTFVDAYAAGDDDAARAQFPRVRAYYERIEPVADTLSDLDPKIDYREVDAVAEGMDWTGFHRIEKDLWVPTADELNADGASAWLNWQPSTTRERRVYAEDLVANVHELHDFVRGAAFTTEWEARGIGALSNGAIGLLDEVATGKITGEEDWWSGTDLWDFAANVEGAKMAYSLVRDLAASQGDTGAALVADIDRGFSDLEADLATHGSLDVGFVTYGELTEAEKRDLTDLINALAEPLSQLTATIVA